MKDILFIVNPLSVKKLKKQFKYYIEKSKLQEKYNYDILYSEYSGHPFEIAQTQLNNYKIIVAAGGDGTVNQISKALINKDILFGIIPLGSGNGLANFLKIPLKIEEALHIIINKQIKTIDTCKLNEHHFINIAGIGFDGYIAHLFANSKNRGLIGYIKNIISGIFKYKSDNYIIKVNNEKLNSKAFIISFANSNQYGNNCVINPNAIIDDGLVDLCILKKFPGYLAPFIAYRFFHNNIDKSKYFKIFKSNEIAIPNNKPIKAHIDGEPIIINNNIRIKIIPKSIKVLL